MNSEIQISGRTAITRSSMSLPCRLIVKHENINGHGLHFGCGKDHAGTEHIRNSSRTSSIVEYDPNYANYSKLLKRKYDFIVANYVLNVLPPKERKNVIKQIRNCLKRNGCAYITVRSIADSKIKGIPEYDGVRTSIGTFQRNYTVEELKKELQKYFKYVIHRHGGNSKKFILMCVIR